jgi:hypothetical protein
MPRRYYFWWWWLVMLALLKSALESTLTANVLIIVGMVVPAIFWTIRWWRRYWLFSLHVQKGKKRETTYRIRPGESSLELFIHLRVPTVIDRFNLRFVLTPRGAHADLGIVRITGFAHSETVFRAPGNARAQQDGKGGVEVMYEPSMRRSPADDMRITLTLMASAKAWEGYLSMRGYDNDGNARFARLSCAVDPTF